MKVSINKTELQYCLSSIAKVIGSSALPVLQGVLMKAVDDKLIFEATDLEKSLRCTAFALVDEEGSAVLPARLFLDIVKSLPDAAVTITATKDSAEIKCCKSSSTVSALDPADFPSFPSVEPEESVTVDGKSFAAACKYVCMAASKDETRPVLTAILLETSSGTVRLIATDSYRLAWGEVAAPDAPDGISSLIPAPFAAMCAVSAAGVEKVTIGTNENQIVIDMGEMTSVSRKIEGNYPNYRQLIPASYDTVVSFPLNGLQGAVKRCSVFANASSAIVLDVDVEGKISNLTASSEAKGSTNEDVEVEAEGANVRIGANFRFLNDGLSAFKGGVVKVGINGPSKPMVFFNDDEPFHYLLMPIRC